MSEEKLSARERRLQGLEAEAESLRQKHRQEISEYQEQVKQHARTVVELEERLVSAAQQAEEDRGVSRPRGQCSAESPKAGGASLGFSGLLPHRNCWPLG